MFNLNKNENLDLIKILKNCPENTRLYSPIYGDVLFVEIKDSYIYPIIVKLSSGSKHSFCYNGHFSNPKEGECMLFPSKTNRDWSTFNPYYKPFEPFDKVLVREANSSIWICDFFSNYREYNQFYYTIGWPNYGYKQCIPYNEETKHLVGTVNDVPIKYKCYLKE